MFQPRLSICKHILTRSVILGLSVQRKHIHIETPGGYHSVSLADYCIKPSTDHTLTFDVMTPRDAIEKLVADSPNYYEIVIGGENNRRGFIRKNSQNSRFTTAIGQIFYFCF